MGAAGELVDVAVAIELECAGLYEVFARSFQGNQELVYFWKLYAEAERYHAASIRIHQTALSGEATTTSVDLNEARTLLEELRSTRTGFEKAPGTIADAIRIARRVEESSAELHGRTQFFADNPEFQELFEKMAEEDRAHRDMLNSAERKFGAA